MRPEEIIASFFQVINTQPELFIGEAKQDLPQLQTAVDEWEYISEENQTQFLADAIIDFCDVNPEIHQALLDDLNQSKDEILEGITEEKQLMLSQKISSFFNNGNEI